MFQKSILKTSNNAKMKNPIWRNVVDALYNFTVK